MNLKNWESISNALIARDIKPIVAVVPDNKDGELVYGESLDNFWGIVKKWEDMGWQIAMHGYQHSFHRVEKYRNIFPFYDRSEFTSLTLQEQSEKIRSSWKLFIDNGIDPTIWVAPAHCFDETTLEALRNETNIRIISDGVSTHAFRQDGFLWIPQQLWDFKKKSFGLWTICLHPNLMSDEQISYFKKNLDSPFFRNRIISPDFDYLKISRLDLIDQIYKNYFWVRYSINKFRSRIKFRS